MENVHLKLYRRIRFGWDREIKQFNKFIKEDENIKLSLKSVHSLKIGSMDHIERVSVSNIMCLLSD